MSEEMNLVGKLNNAMKVMQGIPKAGHYGEGKGGYDYMQADDIFFAVQRSLNEAKLMIIPSIKSCEYTEVESKSGSKGRHVYLTMEFNITDGKESIVATWAGEAIDYGDKAVTKAGTLARKYFLVALFQIATGDNRDDPDSDNQEGAGVPKAEKKQEEKNGKSKRPYAPEDLKKALATMASKVKAPATDKELGTLAGVLTQFTNTEDERHVIQDYLFGKQSLKECDRNMIAAGLVWLDPSYDDGMYYINDNAEAELRSVMQSLDVE